MAFDSVNSLYAKLIIIICQVTTLIQLGIGLTILNPSTPALKSFINSTFAERYEKDIPQEQVDLMVYMAQTGYDVGSTFGSFFVRYTSDYFSRKGSLVLLQSLWLLSTVLMSPVAKVCGSVEAIIVGRVVAGVARGMSLGGIPLYISEITHRKMLASYQGMATWYIEGGLIIGAVIGGSNFLGTPDLLWILFGIPAVFPLLFFCALPWFPQTPSWYVTKREQAKACVEDVKVQERQSLLPGKDSYRLLRKLRSGSEEEVLEEYDLMIDEIESDRSIQRATLWEFFRVPHYRRQLLAGIVIVAGPQLTGITLIFYFSNSIFQAAGLPMDESSYYTIGLFVIVLLLTMLSFPLITRFGAKRIFVYSGVIVMVGLVLLTISSMNPPIIANSGYANVAAAILVIVGGTGPKQTFAILPSELTTYVTRPMVLWLATLVYYVSAVAITFITPFAVDAWRGYAYIPYMVLFLMVEAYVQFCVPETHGKTARQIQEEFKGRSPSSIEDEKVAGETDNLLDNQKC